MLTWPKNAHSLGAIATAAICVALFARGLAIEPRVFHPSGLGSKKSPTPQLDDAAAASAVGEERGPLLATLVQTHTDERVLLDSASPTTERFDALLADRATGTAAPLDPRLVDLLRALTAKLGNTGVPAVELVSGFRSPKLNEMLRKKGHHVASHSQHSLGHAVDFRIVVPCADAGPPDACAGATALALDPRAVVRAIRALGWDGGTGIYTLREDWFVHADVGPNRTWYEGPAGPETNGIARGAN